MHKLPTLLLGVFATVMFSFTGIVLMNDVTIGRLEPIPQEGFEMIDEDAENPVPLPLTQQEELYPLKLSGKAQQGKAVYISMGCIYCHSQQVRRQGFGADYERGWGDRQTVPRDYVRQDRVLLGTMRTGPDLKNVGNRIPDANWHHLHLYDPQMVVEHSTMAPFPFLYETREIKDGKPSPNALQLSGEYAPPPGYEVVPTEEADALVAYLLELRLDYDLPEMKRE